MTVLGIDPGIVSTGFGVVKLEGQDLRALEHGVIETDPDEQLERRLASITVRLSTLIESHRPDALAIEQIFFGRNVRTAFTVGQARGVVLATAGARDLPCHAYTPQAIKNAVCGVGSAGKEQVQRMVTALLGLGHLPASEHAADALAVAICHAHMAPIGAPAGRR